MLAMRWCEVADERFRERRAGGAPRRRSVLTRDSSAPFSKFRRYKKKVTELPAMQNTCGLKEKEVSWSRSTPPLHEDYGRKEEAAKFQGREVMRR